ncbi:alpha/beta fold hydrolase [Nocardia sp. NPDC051570]|uniref:alpha/beta fold hydrolase n=1 Tax=Nocardia sp. NPDC051570 TaxID=3364324 RepID=UPI0037ACB521
MIHARSGGGGDIPLIIVHGGSGSSRLCEALTSALPPEFHWWTVDLPGHGDSAWTPGRYGLDAVGAALVEWAEHEIGSPAWWYGHSYGGQATLAAAGAAPGLFAGLILGDTPLIPEQMYERLEHSTDRMRQWQQWCGLPEDTLLRLLGDEPFGGRTTADVLGQDHPYLRGMAESLHRHDPSFIAALLDDRDAVYRCLVQAKRWLAAMAGPVILFRGDPAVMTMTSDDDVALIQSTGGKVRTFDGVGHGLHHFAPTAVAAAIADYA